MSTPTVASAASTSQPPSDPRLRHSVVAAQHGARVEAASRRAEAKKEQVEAAVRARETIERPVDGTRWSGQAGGPTASTSRPVGPPSAWSDGGKPRSSVSRLTQEQKATFFAQHTHMKCRVCDKTMTLQSFSKNQRSVSRPTCLPCQDQEAAIDEAIYRRKEIPDFEDASKVKSRLASAIDRKRLEKAQRRGLPLESEAYKSLKLTKAEMAEAEAEAVNKVEKTTYEAMMADDSEDSD